MKRVIVYGSMTGNTQAGAEDLAALLGGKAVAAADADAATLAGCDLLVLGASTWGMGELQDDMADFLSGFAAMDVTVSAGAVFGLGDQFGYGDSFVDGIADMAEALKDKGIRLVGRWPTAGYGFSASRAQDGDEFLGLALDQDNEEEKTAGRLRGWAEQIKAEV
ncbi:flavodoxin [Pontiella sp. NLcol2]|uniref:Flavodoxin n=2 Tax=Pontiella agarivorans TaxID=3038953 RepID=A0ABU5MVP4_9BACT|nr:flavodoxin [Pontiella agarivorans]